MLSRLVVKEATKLYHKLRYCLERYTFTVCGTGQNTSVVVTYKCSKGTIQGLRVLNL